MSQKYKDLGTIELPSGRIIISDPCYPVDPQLNCTFPVKPGKWLCRASFGRFGDWGNRTFRLNIVHADNITKKATYRICRVPVDGGHCGFFDRKYFGRNHSAADGLPTEKWYDKICGITLDKEKRYCGTIDNRGVVSSSGIGDGYYTVKAGYEHGEIVAVSLVFLP